MRAILPNVVPECTFHLPEFTRRQDAIRHRITFNIQSYINMFTLPPIHASLPSAFTEAACG